MDVKTAIERGHAVALGQLLAENPSLADTLIRWGRNEHCLTHPLHYVSDILFEGTLQRGKELALVEVLIESGTDLNFQSDREDGKKSDSPLIGSREPRCRGGWAQTAGRRSETGTTRPVRRDGPPLGGTAW
jgi:hypothetical protein